MKFRMERIDSQIKNAVSSIIASMDDVRLAGSFITISEVKTAPDLYSSRISISRLGNESCKEIVDVLNSSKGYIRRELASKIKVKHVPDLFFVEDTTEQNANRIEELLKKIHE